MEGINLFRIMPRYRVKKMDDLVGMNIRDLPQQLTKEVNTYIRLFAVTMLIADNEESGEIPCSGTLVSIKGAKGVLTARHVWEEIAKHKYLLIMLGRVPHVIEVTFLKAMTAPIQSRSENISTDIPDLAFVKLPGPSINHVEAISKAFFSIDKRLDQQSMEFIRNPVGYYALFGAPAELVDHQRKSIRSFAYSTYLSEYFQYEGWDYQIMGLDLDKNPEIPKDFVGMSGGGVWKIKFFLSEDKTRFAVENFTRDITLVGVNFNQTDLPGRQLIGHGPDSIYKRLYGLI